MDRRVFLGTLAGLIAAPLAAEAQQAGRVYRIGVVAAGVNPRSNGFASLGRSTGKNLVIDFQMPKDSRDISAIAARSRPTERRRASLKAAKRATRTIPIVMVALNYDPVEKGHVASLARPGGNITGVFSLAPEQGAKQLEILKEILPRVTLVGVLCYTLPC
jgi:putative ABC transport system substrate-binding protein